MAGVRFKVDSTAGVAPHVQAEAIAAVGMTHGHDRVGWISLAA